jgi:hypothetical protein
MTALTRVTRGENPANSDKLNQVIDAWNGNTAGVNQGNSPLSLTAINDALNYALALKNADAAGKGLIIYAPDGVTPLLRVDKTNGVYASPDGTAAAAPISTTTGTQTLTNKTLTSPHMTGAVVDSGGLTVTAGNIGVGGAAVTNVGLYVNGSMLTTGVNQSLRECISDWQYYSYRSPELLRGCFEHCRSGIHGISKQ